MFEHVHGAQPMERPLYATSTVLKTLLLPESCRSQAPALVASRSQRRSEIDCQIPDVGIEVESACSESACRDDELCSRYLFQSGPAIRGADPENRGRLPGCGFVYDDPTDS